MFKIDTLPEGPCCVCTDGEVLVVLEPCKHSQICYSCVGLLKQELCPQCRTPIEGIRVSKNESLLTLSEIRKERITYEVLALSITSQICVLGSQISGKQTLVDAFTAHFPFSCDKSCQLFCSRFNPNVNYRGHAMRVNTFPRDAPNIYLARDLRKLHPNIFVVCVSVDEVCYQELFYRWHTSIWASDLLNVIFVMMPKVPGQTKEEANSTLIVPVTPVVLDKNLWFIDFSGGFSTQVSVLGDLILAIRRDCRPGQSIM